MNLNANYHVFYDANAWINNTCKKITELTTRDLHWYFVDEISQRPTSDNKWRKKTDLDLTPENQNNIFIDQKSNKRHWWIKDTLLVKECFQ